MFFEKVFNISKLTFLESRLILFTGHILLLSPFFLDPYLAHFYKARFYSYFYLMVFYCSGLIPLIVSLSIFRSPRQALIQVFNTWAYCAILVLPFIITQLFVINFKTLHSFFMLPYCLVIYLHYRYYKFFSSQKSSLKRRKQLYFAIVICTPITFINLVGINLLQESFLYRGMGSLYFIYHLCGLSFAFITLLQCLNDFIKSKCHSASCLSDGS